MCETNFMLWVWSGALYPWVPQKCLSSIMFKHLFRSYLESSSNVRTDDNLWKSNLWKNLKKKECPFFMHFSPLTSESKAWNDLKLSEKLGLIKPLSGNPTKWLITLKQFVSSLQKSSLSVFDYFVGLALKG